MARYVCGLLICGLSYNSSVQATLFTDGPLTASTLPGPLSPLSSSTQIVQLLQPGGITGATVRISDLRDPLIATSTPTALIDDNAAGTLSALFFVDPGWVTTTRWVLLATVRVSKTETSIKLTGTTAPTVNQLIWIGNECMKVTAVSTSNITHTCTVTRAQCGSRAVVHALDPDAYPPGDDGSKGPLIASSRQVVKRQDLERVRPHEIRIV